MLAVAAAAVLWFSRTHARAIELMGPARQQLDGPLGGHVRAQFRFANRTGATLRPRVVWTNCPCHAQGFEPELVEPGAEFDLYLETTIPAEGGRVHASAVVGAEGMPDSEGIHVSIVATYDGRPYLLATPRILRLRAQENTDPDAAAASVVRMDVHYFSPMAAGKPQEDLRLVVEGQQAQCRAERVALSKQGEFAGRIAFDMRLPAGTARTAAELIGPGLPTAKLTILNEAR